MPHFDILTNDNGSVAQILCDGVPYNQNLSLEPLHQIVSTYFRIAASNLKAFSAAQDGVQRRWFGLQAFLMSLTGVEAFTNVFFHLLALERSSQDLEVRVRQRGPIGDRIRDCIALAFDSSLVDQDELLSRIQRLYLLRNEIVHPRWQPTSMTLAGEIPLVIDGLCQNFQATFENEEFCREAFWWSVKYVADVGRAAGNTSISGHCFHWTGQYGLTETSVLEALGLGGTSSD